MEITTNAKLTIDVDIDDLATKIFETDSNHSEIENWVESNLDSYIESWFRNNFDISDYSNDLDVDYLYEARRLLEMYSPGNACRTGEAFTEAIESGFKYLVDESRINLTSLTKAEKSYLVKTEISDSVKLVLDQEFKNLKDKIKPILQEMIAESFGLAVPANNPALGNNPEAII